ncbi:hypothetical protein BC937DRAFT_89720 [Endogone sp. FLAS-F59071]|nr:hypothetical protein BC937DRAFT_89720 [Endogone sp. FLAS-F59071]|eukprot:RUS23250.1 hypothetical protein BC937DRAFT_89720 [Endogone sp. FLAS-F59071]
MVFRLMKTSSTCSPWTPTLMKLKNSRVNSTQSVQSQTHLPVVLRNAPKSLDNIEDDDTKMQTKNNDGSDSDFDDSELASFAYQQLPQDEDERIELQEDEDMNGDVDAEHARPLPAITFKLPTEERISEADLAVINNVMKNFKLPDTAVPDWAKVVPEEAWLPQTVSTTTAASTNVSTTSTTSKPRNLNDDIWDDSDDDTVSYHRSMAEREWGRLHEQHGNAGYKDGIVEGKDLTIQEGFNRGYSEGVVVGKEIGELRGMLR